MSARYRRSITVSREFQARYAGPRARRPREAKRAWPWQHAPGGQSPSGSQREQHEVPTPGHGGNWAFRAPAPPRDRQPATLRYTQRVCACSILSYSSVFVFAAAFICSKRSITPTRLSSDVTESVGCAPTFSQLRVFSASIWMADGSTRGLYQPRFSIMRPSRGERESPTTTRYLGAFFFPT